MENPNEISKVPPPAPLAASTSNIVDRKNSKTHSIRKVLTTNHRQGSKPNVRSDSKVDEDDISAFEPGRWKIVKKRLPQLLELGRKEGVLENNDNQTNNNNGDGQNANNQTSTGLSDGDDKKDEDVIKVLTDDVSLAHSAIPYLPLPVAIVCLVLNVCIPGFGTICSGFSTICVGQPRLSFKEGRVFMSVVINIVVGIAQLSTVTFLFVGWFWSIAWGGLIFMHAIEYRTALMQKRQEAVATAAIEALTKDAILRKRDVQNLVQNTKDEKEHQRRKSSIGITLNKKLSKKAKGNKDAENKA